MAAGSLPTYLKGWICYETPPGESPRDHLVATNLRRMVDVVTAQGVLLLAVLGPLLSQRLMALGAVYLILTSLTRLIRRRSGTQFAYSAIYVICVVILVPYVAFSGGIYSYAVMTVVLLAGACWIHGGSGHHERLSTTRCLVRTLVHSAAGHHVVADRADHGERHGSHRDYDSGLSGNAGAVGG